MPARASSKKISSKELTVRIGKKGLADSQIAEIIKHLDKGKTVKVKVLRTALTSDTVESISRKVSLATSARVTQIIGHTFTLSKPKNEEVSIYKTAF